MKHPKTRRGGWYYCQARKVIDEEICRLHTMTTSRYTSVNDVKKLLLPANVQKNWINNNKYKYNTNERQQHRF